MKELCDSHYLPQRVYAFSRAKQLKNPNPVMSHRGELKQISDQYRGYVFCESCEDLLNKRGERWVLANVPQDYDVSFPLQDGLAPLTPILSEDRFDIYNISGEKGFEIEKLVYFGMSVFWRGAVHRWNLTVGEGAPRYT